SQGELLMDIARGKAGRTTFHQEAANAILGPGPDDCQVRYATVGDPHLRTIQDVRIPVAACTGSHAGWIAPGIRLRQPKTPNHFAPCHARQPTLLLFFRTKGRNWKHGKRTLYRHE